VINLNFLAMKRGNPMRVVPILLLAMLVLPGHLVSQTYVHVNISQATELTAEAGSDSTIFPGQSLTLGGTPTAEGGTGSLTYTWHPPYHIESIGLPNPLATPPGNVTYTLLVTDERGCTATDQVIITVIGGTGMNDNNPDGDLILYPNPSNGTIQIGIQGSRVTDMNVSVFNLTGQIVFNAFFPHTGIVPTVVINLTTLPRGSYILRISGDFGDIYRNIILN